MKSDIDKLLIKLDRLYVANDEARGTSNDLVKAAPLEIEFYNITTRLKRDLDSFQALLKDANGIYMEEKK